jgi:hypothetical protein
MGFESLLKDWWTIRKSEYMFKKMHFRAVGQVVICSVE